MKGCPGRVWFDHILLLKHNFVDGMGGWIIVYRRYLLRANVCHGEKIEDLLGTLRNISIPGNSTDKGEKRRDLYDPPSVQDSFIKAPLCRLFPHDKLLLLSQRNPSIGRESGAQDVNLRSRYNTQIIAREQETDNYFMFWENVSQIL